MGIHDISILISTLKEENKTNSKEDREFNLEWIRLLRISISNALEKKYGK